MPQNIYLLDGGHLVASATRSPKGDWDWRKFAALIPTAIIEAVEAAAMVSSCGAVGEYRFEMEGA